jgi:hypothetical protein
MEFDPLSTDRLPFLDREEAEQIWVTTVPLVL